MLPPTEHPEVFGQNFNADIASQIAEARMLFDTLLSLRPQVSGPTAAGAGPSREDKVGGAEVDVKLCLCIFLNPSISSVSSNHKLTLHPSSGAGAAGRRSWNDPRTD